MSDKLPFEMKGDFWDSMCHELRTPLSTIVTASDMLLTPLCPEQKQNECVTTLRNSAVMLKKLIDDMLDCAKLRSGKMTLNKDNFSTLDMIDEAVSIVKIKAEEKNIDFRIEVGNIPEKLFGDPFRIKQIIVNLLSNAIKFTDNGFVKLEISAEKESENVYLLKINVSDSGIGINEYELNNIFGRFQQASANHLCSCEGTGLGLAICKELIALMDGNISVESSIDKGSVFTVTLRLQNENLAAFA